MAHNLRKRCLVSLATIDRLHRQEFGGQLILVIWSDVVQQIPVLNAWKLELGRNQIVDFLNFISIFQNKKNEKMSKKAKMNRYFICTYYIFLNILLYIWTWGTKNDVQHRVHKSYRVRRVIYGREVRLKQTNLHLQLLYFKISRINTSIISYKWYQIVT